MNSYGINHPSEILKAISVQGFHGVEISTEPRNPMAFQPERLFTFSFSHEMDWDGPAWNMSMLDAKKLIESHGLSCESFNAACELCHPKSVEILMQRIEMARMFNVKKIVVTAGSGWETEEAQKKAINHLRMICHYALQYDVDICLKTDGWLVHSPQVIQKVVEQVNLRNLKIDYDPANIIYYDDSVDLLGYLNAIIENIGVVHLRGSSGRKGDKIFPELGVKFDIYRKIFSVLNENNFTGMYCVDLENAYLWEPDPRQIPMTIGYFQNKAFDRDGLEKSQMRMKSSLEYLATITRYVF